MKMKNRWLYVVAAGFAALIAAGCGTPGARNLAAGKSSETFLLRLKAEPGLTLQYDFEAELGLNPPQQQGAPAGEPIRVRLTGIQEQKFVKVDGPDHTIESRFRDIETEAQGIGLMLAEGLKNTLSRTQTFESNELGVLRNANDSFSVTPQFPAKAVAVGETWTSPAPPAETNATGRMTGKLAAVETVDGRRLLRLEYTGTAANGITLTEPMVAMFDPDAGRIVSMKMSATGNQMGADMSLSLSLTLRR
ncbi:MAG: hypothetical protein SNJ76_00115 [Fimbriimonadaceae bacterium]